MESLETELYDAFNAEISAITSNDLLKTPVEICEKVCEHFNEHMDVYTMLMGEHGDAQFTYKIGNLLNEKVYELFITIFPNMDKAKYDFTYNFGKFGLVGLVYCWCSIHPEWSPRQVAEMWLSLTTLGLWGILGEEGKEVLINAHNSR